MYDTYNEFQRDVFQCGINAYPYGYTDRDLASVEVAWKVYQNALHTNLDMLVMGRFYDPAHPERVAVGIDDSIRQNFGITNEIYGGAVLNAEHWTILVNDAWVMGGIHAHVPFHLASPRGPINIFDATQERLTVTGRELIGVVSFGYHIRAALDAGEVAECVDQAIADTATFPGYMVALGRYAGGEWQDLVDPRAVI